MSGSLKFAKNVQEPSVCPTCKRDQLRCICELIPPDSINTQTAKINEEERPRTPMLWRAHWLTYMMGCAFVVLLWFLDGRRFPWFIYPITLFTITLEIHLFHRRAQDFTLTKEQKKRNWFYFHICFFLTTNSTITVTWWLVVRSQASPFPWFIYPLFLMGLALLIHYCVVYFPQRLWMVHITAYAMINILLVVTWFLTPWKYPWFAWVMGSWAFVLIVAAVITHLKKKGIFHKLNYKPVSLPEPVNVTIDIPPPSYEVRTVTQGSMSSFPSLPDIVKQFNSMPNISPTESDPILSTSEKFQRYYNTAKF